MTLLLAIVVHALLGIALAVVTWLAGASIALRLPGARLENAYVAGLLLVGAAAFGAALSAWLVPLALGTLAVATWLGLRECPDATRARAGRSLALALPGTFAFAVALGAFQHGPSDTRGSNAFGDLVFYVAELTSAAQSVAPFRDLSVAELEHTYLQSAPAIVGGALAALPGFDAFLFFATTLPAFLFAALAIGLGVVGARPTFVLVLLGVGAFAYPTWLSESAPATLAAPVVFSLLALAAAPTLATVALAAAGLVATKGFGLVALAGVALAALSRRAAAAVVLIGAGVVGGALWASWLTELVTLEFLPADALRGLEAQLDARSTQELAPALLVAGHVLLLVAAVRVGNAPLTAVVAAAVTAAWLVGGHGPDAAVLLAILFVAVELPRTHVDRTTTLVAIAAGALLVAAAWFREVAGVGTGAVLLALAAIAFARLRPIVLAPAAAVVVLLGATGGALRLDPSSPPLTSEHHELWTRVGELVPRDGLVFTSLTGEEIEAEAGWNYFSAISGRQHYVAGWANSELRVRSDERERRLGLNTRALAGDAGPALIDVGGRARPLFAVLRRSEPHPPGSRRMFANARFALFELTRP